MIPYSIGEFANIIGVTTSTLRYYEKEGLLTPHRNENNNIREYTDHDIGWMRFLLHLKDSGMSIAELKQYIQHGEKWVMKRFMIECIYLKNVSTL